MKLGTASQEACATALVSITPSTAEIAQPTAMPARIGTRRKMPRPSTATSRVVSKAGIEIIIAVL